MGQYKLTAYDASYLELAIRHNLPIAASDNALVTAAHRGCQPSPAMKTAVALVPAVPSCRVMVAMCVNSDLGDSWQWADEPLYPEKFSPLGIRIGVNYIVYAMTH